MIDKNNCSSFLCHFDGNFLVMCFDSIIVAASFCFVFGNESLKTTKPHL